MGRKFTKEKEKELANLLRKYIKIAIKNNYNSGWVFQQVVKEHPTFTSPSSMRNASAILRAKGYDMPMMPCTKYKHQAKELLGDPSEADILRERIKMLEKVLKQYKSKDVKKATTTEIITELFESSLATLPKEIKMIPINRPVGKIFKPQVACLDLGDWHMGQVVDPNLTGGITEYSFDIFKHRLRLLRDSIIEIMELERSKIPIDTLYINGLGDFVTGEHIYLNQPYQIDRAAIDQVVEGSQFWVEEFFIPLLKVFKKVRMYAVAGNHGRVGQKGEYNYKTNWDYMFYKFVETMLTGQKRFEMFTSESSMMIYEYPEAPDYKHLIAHGDEVRSWMGIPFYGLERFTSRVISLYNIPINYVHIGHHHRKCDIDIAHGELMINGSAVGGSVYSVKDLQVATPAKQLFYGFSPSRGKTWQYDLVLSKIKILKADSNHVYTPYKCNDF